MYKNDLPDLVHETATAITTELVSSETFGDLAIIKSDSDLWFIGKEVCKYLDYSYPSATLTEKVDERHLRRISRKTFPEKQISMIWHGRDHTDKKVLNLCGVEQLVDKSKSNKRDMFKVWINEINQEFEESKVAITEILDNNHCLFEGHAVEMVEIEGEILFNAKDVAELLEMSDVTVRRHIQGMSEKQVVKLKNSDVQNMNIRKLNNAGENFLTESGLYKLAFRSNKESAERFTDWVTDEVIPQIRKTGGYIPIDENMSEMEVLSRAVIISNNTIKELNKRLEDLRPRAEFAEYISCSTDTVDVDTMAKILKQNGFNKLGTNGFFKWLRENKYLKITNGENVPTQKSINLKIMKIKETATEDKDGNIRIHRQARITPKGQEYFIKKFKEAENDDK